eukprot:c22011_g1_i1 orf=564-2171(+)
MAELDAVSSAPLAVDLNLNLGPSFALELALGQDFEEVVPVMRPNWPRFEPGILAGGQEDEAPPMAEEPHVNLPTSEDHQDSTSMHIRARDLTGFDAGNSSRSAPRGAFSHPGRENRDDPEGSLRGVLQAFRHARHTRHPRRPRQVVFAPIQDLVQTQDSSEHGSTTESRAVGASDSALSVILPRPTRSERSPSTILEIAPPHESSQQSGKKTEAGVHFECNICLEMATEPVVTCCGHLFCWPCLYQWLHLHSSQKECPVCKGVLSDDVITPIYGRGTTQDTDKTNGSTPSRPHAHRINGKRHWHDRFGQDRPGRGTAAVGAEVHTDRHEPEASNAAELVLNRLRVAQRLQREYIDERFRLRLHQQLIRRRGGGAFRSPATVGPTTQASASPTQGPDQHPSENVLTRLAINRLETADSLAAIGVSMDGLRENLENMQRTLEIATLPVPVGIASPGEGATAGSSAVAEPLPNEGRARSLSEIEVHSPGHSTNAELQIETPELPQTSRSGWHRAGNGASGSFDAEPGSMHARKRRRLN